MLLPSSSASQYVGEMLPLHKVSRGYMLHSKMLTPCNGVATLSLTSRRKLMPKRHRKSKPPRLNFLLPLVSCRDGNGIAS